LGVLLAGLPVHTTAQAPKATDRASLERAARELIAGAKYGTLITLGPDGHSQARTVENLPPEADFSVWFATTPRTRKVAEIRRDPRVTMHWFDPAKMGYVTLIGRARLVNDSAEKARRWKPGWEAFYPDWNRDYLLVQVRPLRLEVVSPAHGISGDSLTWRPPAIEFRPPASKRP
jgi:general stress protein 26